MKRIFVTGIGTDVGKTVVSAILTEALQADYWKPVQSGSLENTDTQTVQQLVSNARSFFHPEAYRFEAPLSPHAAAKIEDQEIELTKIQVPETENTLLIEGAGGLLVPLNDRFLILDLVKQLDCPVVVVSRNYLGSINHTLLTLESLKQHRIPVAGLVFNGDPNPETENFILNYTGVPKLFSVPVLPEISKETIRKIAETVRTQLPF
ncbi:MAG TPA: dethiobiotin synthase [Adhaeribacter sp.]|nr:dethiobiotin synthase [Adhaeribacter sp.]